MGKIELEQNNGVQIYTIKTSNNQYNNPSQMGETVIKVLIVDDNSFMRNMLKQLIEADGDCQVAAEADNSAEALKIIATQNFDVILIDVSLEGGDSGVHLVRTIRKYRKNIPILNVSIHEESMYADQLRQAGAQGYLMKQDAIEHIIPAIRQVYSGKTYWPRQRKVTI